MIGWLVLLASASWYDQKMEGWYYFEDAEKQQYITPEEAEEAMSAEREYLKELLSLAVLVPTKENVANYVREQKRWSEQSSLFANTWAEVARGPKVEESCFLLFCFNGKDERAQEAAAAAQAEAAARNLQMKGVALDGVLLEGFDCVADRGISKRLNLSEGLYLVDPSQNQIIPFDAGQPEQRNA